MQPRPLPRRPENPVAASLTGLAAGSARRPRVVLALILLLAALSLVTAAHRLGVSTDTTRLFSASAPWMQRQRALLAAFPQTDKLIVAALDAPAPEQADDAATALATALAADPAHFRAISRPDALPYFTRNAFLLAPAADRRALLDRLTDAQPFLGTLAADPSLSGLCAALRLALLGAEHGQDLGPMAPALHAFGETLAQAAAGHPEPLSWQTLLGGKLAAAAGKYRFVLARPVLDYAALAPGGAATAALRQAASRIPAIASGQVRLRLTGQVVIDDEEFASVAQGAVGGLLGSLALVALWLFLALRSWRLILPVLVTLIAGLILTTGFAAAAIGRLNLISVAFAVLFTGIAVDFGIQFTVRFRARLNMRPQGVAAAIAAAARSCGAQILVAALATAAGFLAFTPTSFAGVAELGAIAGFGMLVALTLTLTLLPALLALTSPRADGRETGFLAPLAGPVQRRAGAIAAVFTLAALAGAACALHLPFDGDPLHTKNQHSEAIRTLYDLMQNPLTNPYSIQAVTPSLEAADAAAARYAALPQTALTLTLSSFVPHDQRQALAEIADTAAILAPTLTAPATLPPVTAATLRRSVTGLAAALTAALPKLPPASPLRPIAAAITRLATAPDATLLAANDAVSRYLPLQLTRLREALACRPVTLADVPAELRAAWLLPDGRARVQALPARGVADTGAMRLWADAAQAAIPETTGPAIFILRAADTITGAFATAALFAIVSIALILLASLRRLEDTLLVLAPLLTGAALTALAMRLLGMKLNFANIIALPLLLGVGVSFNIYFVMNYRAGARRFLGTATARAVAFSALTTGTAFGSLALSAHPGTASMGTLLLLSLGCTVLTSLVFLPALLTLRRGRIPGA